MISGIWIRDLNPELGACLSTGPERGVHVDTEIPGAHGPDEPAEDRHRQRKGEQEAFISDKVGINTKSFSGGSGWAELPGEEEGARG